MSKSYFQSSVAIFAVAIAMASSSFAKDGQQATQQFQPIEQIVIDGDTANRTVSKLGDLNARYGNIDAFWGNLDAFWGNLDAFDGRLNAQYGNLDAFWGNLDAFYGNLDAFWGNLDAFYGSLDAFYGSLDAFWGNLDAFGSPTIKSDFQSLFNQAELSFGAAVTSTTGKTFDAAVRAPLLEKYGVDATDFSGIENLTRDQYASLLLEFHDSVMSFTGFDHVDHWMATTNWSPLTAQNAGGGSDVHVGLLDTDVVDTGLVGGKIDKNYGYDVPNQNHGAAVLSLVAAAHDGKGGMGVAPDVMISVYNPFDATFTASWNDVTIGMTKLGARNTSIINMSLGVPGWTLHQGWSDVFGDVDVIKRTSEVVFVKAAGNEGTEQSTDIEWGSLDVDDRLLIVGSVDPSGQISTFSNTPGNACLLNNGECDPSNFLMNRFLVAPGELLLVSDNAGGVTRASGTSFAAPLVTGAVALLQSRWSWLKQHPVETAEIILRSATDLGAPGVDGTYGRGLLNIGASQAPLDPNALIVETSSGPVSINGAGLTQIAHSWIDSSATVTAFEYIGETYRDFQVPVSDFAVSQSIDADSSRRESEDYLEQRAGAQGQARQMSDEASSNLSLQARATFTDRLTLGTVKTGNTDSRWTASFTAKRRTPNDIVAADAVPFQMSAIMTNNTNDVTLRFGEGHGALALSGDQAFSLMTDFNIETGGVNPFLGLASGGFYAGAAFPLNKKLSFLIGYTQGNDSNAFVDTTTGELREVYTDIEDYRSSALNVELQYTVANSLNFTASYTQLREATGLLGGQGSGVFNLEGGAYTDALSFGVNTALTGGIVISGSATVGKTRATDFDTSIFSVGEGGITSTAFQFALSKFGVLGKGDKMRLSISQPLHIETGALGITSKRVIDRATGEIGLFTQETNLYTQDRGYVSELLYATPILDGKALLSGFGRVQLNNHDLGATKTGIAGGGRLEFKF